MSHIERPLSISDAPCPTSNVRSRLRTLDVPHRTSAFDFGRSMSHIERPIPTSCPRCPTRRCSATIHSADNSFQSPLLRGNVHDAQIARTPAPIFMFQSPLLRGNVHDAPL